MSLADRGQPVSDDERRASLEKLRQRLLNQRLRLRVQVGGRFIQDQDRRVLEQRAVDREADQARSQVDAYAGQGEDRSV